MSLTIWAAFFVTFQVTFFAFFTVTLLVFPTVTETFVLLNFGFFAFASADTPDICDTSIPAANNKARPLACEVFATFLFMIFNSSFLTFPSKPQKSKILPLFSQ